MKFIHGEYNLTLCGEHLITHAYGPWNLECVYAYTRDYVQEVAPVYGARWADITILEGESLMVPAAEARLRHGIAIAAEHGLASVALVLENSSVRNSTRAQLDNIYEAHSLPHRFFDHYQDALQWSLQAGYALDRRAERVHFQKNR
ncbi:hypothetical protein OCL06_02310 [Alteromonas sp. ASW11-19]|uniref:STAS/SEC14 domain-containing protein n=1 Tax=Alteromonas salexigens TaxID=2982530 RepID=A0ABT2VKW0_9ALTE|nr:hypothetical protein [Alteromonas salexigens]MCU7553427.1 hypothetical protein [Alteromonas salexigens]